MDYGRVLFESAGEASAFASPAFAFVGIYAHAGELIFRLPLGYPIPAEPLHYETARDLHIRFFKLFQRFRSVCKRNQSRQKKEGGKHEDAGAPLQDGREWVVRHDEGEVYYYRHFDVFDSLLDAFDELAILGLERRLKPVTGSPCDLRYFDRTDAGRIYQNDDTFFDDAAFQPVATITALPSDLVGMYCYLLRDLRQHLWGDCDPAPLRDDVSVLAEKFELRHLWPTASCWEADEWLRTRDTLRDKLDIIDHVTCFKDETHHRLYEAVARFLCPPADIPKGNGILWGIDGFWPVWEWMVLTRLASEDRFKARLRWIETCNLSSETIDALEDDGFTSPMLDARVLCAGGDEWATVLSNGRILGRPYPDAIVEPAQFEPEWTPEKDLRWIEKLTLREGPVAITLSGTCDYLATTGANPAHVQFRTRTAPTAPQVDENTLAPPELYVAGTREPFLDRPEICAMLRRLGQWDAGAGAFWRCAPFNTLQDAQRKHIGGLLLIDAKYKKPDDSSHAWAADHRKQSAYEDVLTLSGRAAAYSIYICPGQPVTQESIATLVARDSADKAHFEREFDVEWNKLVEVTVYGATFKDARQILRVMGKTTSVAYGTGQKLKARNALLAQVFPASSGTSAQLKKYHVAHSLLAVDRFPGNSQFFFKAWPIRDIVEEMVHVRRDGPGVEG